MKDPKTFFMRTYGCQMNENDTEVMCGMLEKRGLIRTEDESGADLLLYNTCSIRDLAERKVMGKLGKLGRITWGIAAHVIEFTLQVSGGCFRLA